MKKRDTAVSLTLLSMILAGCKSTIRDLNSPLDNGTLTIGIVDDFTTDNQVEHGTIVTNTVLEENQSLQIVTHDRPDISSVTTAEGVLILVEEYDVEVVNMSLASTNIITERTNNIDVYNHNSFGKMMLS